MNLIDWKKVQRGTMTTKGEIVGMTNQHDYPTPRLSVLYDSKTGLRVTDYTVEYLRIVPATRWTYHEGGECPVPEGVICEAMWGELTRPTYETIRGAHAWDKIIAYRITGVDRAGGFTDDPAEGTE